MLLSKIFVAAVIRNLTTTTIKMSSSCMKDNLIWVDLEMTGLDVEHDRILEIACVITDADLRIIAEGPNLVLHEPDHVLDNMNKWCINQHGKSGLSDEVRRSRISLTEAEDLVLSFVKKHTLPNTSPLAGNTVHMDRMFLDKYMPRLAQHMHYRIVDVSTIKELSRRWFPDARFSKRGCHRAIDDIRESIEELLFYRRNIFKS